MQFPGVLANDDISLTVNKGEVFALVGENGAGKSTLMNLLYGIYTPTGGEIFIRGRRVERYNPKYAIDQGVGMVHQHFMLVPSFTAAQNIVMRKEPKKLGLFYDNAEAIRQTRALVEEYAAEYNQDGGALPRGVVLLTYPDSCQLWLRAASSRASSTARIIR